MAGYPSGEPAWQTAILDNLSKTGQLSGVNPVILGAIAQEESGFEDAGAGFNSSGYGGYFGLGTGAYAGGESVSKSTLLTNSPQSFTEQAIVAADAFNSYMQEAIGEGYTGTASIVGRAETIFQQGGNSKGIESGGGVPLIAQALGTANPGGSSSPASSGSATATTTGLDTSPLNGFGIPGTVIQGITGLGGGAIASGLGGVIAAITAPLKQYLTDAALIIFGIIFILAGLIVVVHATGNHDRAVQIVQGRGKEGLGAGALAGDAGEAAVAA